MAECPTPPMQAGTELVSSLCTTGHRANLLTGVILNLLRDHFSRESNLEFNGQGDASGDKLAGYVWNKDAKQTHIQIQPVWMWNVQDVQRLPAIYVRRDALRSGRVILGDKAAAGAARNADGGIKEVKGDYCLREISGSHAIFCVGKTGAEVELLGQETFNHLTGFAPVLRREFKLHRFELTDWGAIGNLEESSEHFVVPLSCRWVYEDSWRIDKLGPQLKSVYVGAKAD